MSAETIAIIRALVEARAAGWTNWVPDLTRPEWAAAAESSAK